MVVARWREQEEERRSGGVVDWESCGREAAVKQFASRLSGWIGFSFVYAGTDRGFHTLGPIR